MNTKLTLMKKIGTFLILALSALHLTGCIGYSDVQEKVAIEAQKITRIGIGMTVSEVKAIMGTDLLIFNYPGGTSTYGRPLRVDKFSDAQGRPIDVYYYRSSTKNHDGLTTDDETTAIIFVNGKVDAITSGDTSKTVIEVRRR